MAQNIVPMTGRAGCAKNRVATSYECTEIPLQNITMREDKQTPFL